MTSPPKKLGFEFSGPLGPGEGSALHCYIILYIRYSKTQSIGNLLCCTCRRFYPCRLQSLKQSTIATCARNRASGLLPVPGRASCKLRVNLLHVQYSRQGLSYLMNLLQLLQTLISVQQTSRHVGELTTVRYCTCIHYFVVQGFLKGLLPQVPSLPTSGLR